MNNAYLTLLSSEEYLWSVLALNYSLKQTKTLYKLVCAITDNIYCDKLVSILQQEDILVEKIPYISYQYPETETYFHDIRLNNTLSKFSIYLINGYDKLLFLDSDMFVLRNLDKYFEFSDTSHLGSEFAADYSAFLIDFNNLKYTYQDYCKEIAREGDEVTDFKVYANL